MEAFFKEIGMKIREAVKEDVKKILKEVGDEQIYAAALVTDSDCISLYLVVNTYEKMRQKDLKYLEWMKSDLEAEEIEGIKGGSLSITKWIPDEWAYSGGRGCELSKVSQMLFTKEEENSAEYAEHTALFFEAVTDAWKALISDKVFGEKSEEITYFISISDDEKAETIENYSASLLNGQEVYEAFMKRDEETV